MFLVLFSALLHASWNAVVKSSPDKFLDIVLVTTGAALLALISLPFVPSPAFASWPYLALSGLIHVVYFALVGAVYRSGDMSYAYPLMRGTPPLLVAVISGPLLGEHISVGGWGGIVLICGGILSLAFFQPRLRNTSGRPMILVLVNAVMIVFYTLVDGVGVRLSGHAVAYTMWLFLLTAIPIALWALLRRRDDMLSHLRDRWHFALIGGFCTVGAYALVLWAMTRLPIAMVAALRETAILFGIALSVLVLKERFGWHRYVGAAAMMAGAVVLKLA